MVKVMLEVVMQAIFWLGATLTSSDVLEVSANVYIPNIFFEIISVFFIYTKEV